MVFALLWVCIIAATKRAETPRRIPRPDYLSSFFGAAAAGQFLDSLDLFATCLGVWAWERAIEKQEYRSFPGEWVADAPINVFGKAR
jgi:hypothetical protein